MRAHRIATAIVGGCLPGAAHAHSFGAVYNLPVPFWLYAWGASAALLISFVIAGVFLAAPAAPGDARSHDLGKVPLVAALRRAHVLTVLQGVAVAALLLSIATGFFGSRDPYRNFSMTAFWIVFVLAFAYLTAVIGNVYAAINPWQTLAAGLDRVVRGFARGRLRYPERLGDWPALALYLAFIWFELFGPGRPFSLAMLLLGYTLLNVLGVWLVGAAAWFRHCELFAVFLRLTALMAPIDYRPGQALRWRLPFAGLVRERPQHLGTVVFALAMLATTAFDGLHATQAWVYAFWKSEWIAGLIGRHPVTAYALLKPWYIAWGSFWLLVSPFVYLGVYAAFVALARAVARSARPLRELMLDFGYTLLPIALVYHVTHYFTLVVSQGVKIVNLLSDPFGWGWNLFGTAGMFRAPVIPDVGVVWHTQVGLILLGHVVSVWVAHLVALRVFGTRRQALASQVPMLALMVLFTVAGLWILAQPLTAMRSL